MPTLVTLPVSYQCRRSPSARPPPACAFLLCVYRPPQVLQYVADQSAHHPDRPLQMWELARQELGASWFMQTEASAHLKLKHWRTAAATSRNPVVSCEGGLGG